MKVLVLHSELGVLRGGGENFTRNLFTAFAGRGHHVSAVFVADSKGRYPLPLPATIDPIPLRGWWSRKLGQEGFLFVGSCLPTNSRYRVAWDRLQEAICWRSIRWHDQRFQRHVARKLASCWHDFDAVYVHGNIMLASEVAEYRPTVLRLPGPPSAELEPVLRKVHAVCANGDVLIKIRRFLGDHAVELPIGVDQKLFKPGPTSVRSSLGWTDQDRVIGYVGRLNYLKGTDLLAAAFHEISKTVANSRLLIIGQGESELGIRTALANELARGIVYIERDVDHEQLPQWYRAMDLFVMPSRYENFSNALLEAMACGIPFLVSDVGGNRILAESNAGWLFEPDSESSLAKQLRKLLNKNFELNARGMASIDYSQRCCGWQATAERLEQILATRLGVS